MRYAAFLLCLFEAVSAWDTSNFFDWFRTELSEIEDAPLHFTGHVPSYLTGTFVQTGPARFEFGHMKFTHMLDGYSKINKVQFSKDGASATYSTKFLASQFMNESIRGNSIARGLFVGAIEPPPHWGPTAAVLGANDNNYIKMRQVGTGHMMLSDTMIATDINKDCLSFEKNIRSEKQVMSTSGQKWNDNLEPMGDMCMLGVMAHADEDPVTGVFTGAMGCFGMEGNYHMLFNIEPAAPTVRKLVAKIRLPRNRGPSYMHAMASTPNYLVLIAEPLYLNLPRVLAGAGLGLGGLKTNEDPTLFQIVNRKTGAVRVLEAPGFIYGHVVNSFEDGTDVVIDLTWYAANDPDTMGWMNRWFMSYMGNDTVRENWPRGKVMRYRLKSDGKVEQSELFAEEKGENDFETPKINEKLIGRSYCIAYFMQFHSYAYDKSMHAMEGGPMGAVGIAKRNLCTGERMGWYQPNMYPSEVHFVPNPSGTAEDDGVLLSMVFNGNTNSSHFQVLDAQRMEPIATAELPIKTPFLIHASYFTEKSSTPSSSSEVIV